ncbi:DNA glycosylase AlkZ-like family protein [Streptococcus suis]|uniref:DNA glycosylase AlkZ-like family protein n=1 Tax=Streptococcus suis TaxID=1307 RepID=UPI001BAA546F|nr:crosslink repair DNA glycosylase YcaQ family protein [Streptococcus suis]MBS0734267.1 winged helix DNA-binding domain-containing protein [Streptococcus suis]MBS0743906.1 winged helix DNA-binding domain-containing protein [Streptococcus suis]MBS0765184.1 winged helix DNA-binding domain-containing protein [Streptococcus suis]MBS0780923.1 winged helix DNA-binding domain-containing protein [Streptococcus suis]MBS0783144.1 winged helix DNA-binding domain-containing protein [Streptococcus suis]
MHHDTWKGIILQKQGLLKPQSVQQICQNLNGLQAQFQPYVHVGFRNRMTAEDFHEGSWQEELTRQWSIRRTVHAYLESEIPLYIHEGRLVSTDYLKTEGRDGFSPQTKQKYHHLILEALEQGPMTREDLKVLCREEKMTQKEEKLVFNAWGGLFRYMVERGEVYQEYGAKRFHRLTDFQPLSREKAELEIARRYFSGFGPVSLADARYYFKENKSTILEWMAQLDLKTIQVAGEERFYLGVLDEADLPQCLFVAGFDQLLLGYEKKNNPFFDPKYIRNIYTLTGIVKPVVFYKGRFVATWKRDKGTILLDIFESITQKEEKELDYYRQMYEKIL